MPTRSAAAAASRVAAAVIHADRFVYDPEKPVYTRVDRFPQFSAGPKDRRGQSVTTSGLL